MLSLPDVCGEGCFVVAWYVLQMSNDNLIVTGSIDEGDRRFGNISRRRQNAFVSASNLLYANACRVLQ